MQVWNYWNGFAYAQASYGILNYNNQIDSVKNISNVWFINNLGSTLASNNILTYNSYVLINLLVTNNAIVLSDILYFPITGIIGLLIINIIIEFLLN